LQALLLPLTSRNHHHFLPLLSSTSEEKRRKKKPKKGTHQKTGKKSTTSSTATTFPKQSPEKNPLGEKKSTSKKLLDKTRIEKRCGSEEG
jgi:hypothetical protein